MTEEPENASSDPAPASSDPARAEPSEAVQADPASTPHRHRFLIGALFTLATIIGAFAVLAVWVNRQVLNTDNWTNTSSQLLADKQIQTALSAYLVNELFKTGVPRTEVKDALSGLPKSLQALDGPITSGLEQVAGQVAPRVLASSAVQSSWRAANRATHATLLRIINGGGNTVSTNGGVVTLNLHALVDRLASALGVESAVNSARSKLQENKGTVNAVASKAGVTLPASSGQLVVMRAKQLKTAQDVARGIKGLAILLPILAFGLFILAVWLSKGHRQQAVRMTGWCFVGIGLVVLIARRLLGNYFVDALVKLPANKPAAHDAWTIATTLLYDIGAALIVYGLVVVVCAWLGGRTRAARSVRRAIAPTLHDRPVAYYVGVYIALLLVILWGPTPATRQLPYIIGFIVVLAVGVTGLRRQTEREFPDVKPEESMHLVRAWRIEGGQAPATAAAAATPATANGGRIGELERLATLHDRGALTDSEYATEKAALFNGS